MQTSKKKMVYLVRHAQSKGNAGGLRGHASHPLSEAGEEQSVFIAERCAKLPIKQIVTSTMVRAEQTGDVIGKRLGIVPTSSDLFIEALAPSFFRGKPADDPEILVVQQLIVQNFGVPGWKHSDEENFDDLRTRVELALDYLEQSDDDMLVVTHGWFMRMLMAVAMFGKGMTPDEALRCIRMFHMENTGITALGYDGTKADPWWLWVWNDHAHLG